MVIRSVGGLLKASEKMKPEAGQYPVYMSIHATVRLKYPE